MHNLNNLVIGVYKPGNTYIEVYDMVAHPSSHGPDIFYLFVDALVQWDDGYPRHAYTILIQYSTQLGGDVRLQQPPHILPEDALLIAGEFYKFVTHRQQYHSATNSLKP